MVGRGALGNPFIFREIKALLQGKTATPPTFFEKITASMRQVDLMIEEKGEAIAIPEARKHLAWYVKGERGASALKVAINQAKNLSELKNCIEGNKNE